ncbi:MAG: YqaA family protein [Pseudomonadota bacterium]|nr:YqaA family protein [Pseudomonadota bacterium]
MEASGYSSIFLSAFLAATILPLSSEAVLVALTASEGYELWMLIALASVGNTVGAAVNWTLGRYCLRWLNRSWFPVSPDKLEKASVWFSRYGHYTLLFAWLPIVGDPLTVAAGLLRLNFTRFLLLVATGKTLRYVVVGLTTQAILT